jgi:hypothetical protein
MASEKKIIDFNEYWNFFKIEAEHRGLSDSEFMKLCKIPRQRYYEFTAKRNLTGHYMWLLMEGLNLSQQQIEEKTKRKFTDKQQKELKISSWIAAHRDIVESLVDNPQLLSILRSQISMLKK